MTTYSFTAVAGTAITFDRDADVLAFAAGFSAASLDFVQSGANLVVSSGGLSITLRNTTLGSNGVRTQNFSFADGSVLRIDTAGGTLRTGTNGDDWLAFDLGGPDTLDAGRGNDKLVGGDALDPADSINGGAGNADLMTLAGNLDVTFLAGTVTGVEIFRLGAGTMRLVLAANTLGSATPAGGAVTIDGAATNSLTLDAAASPGRAVLVLGGAGADTLIGGNAGDVLSGGLGDDSLLGGAGADTLAGGGGSDTLIGGAGNDVFDFSATDAVQSAPDRPDLIVDFAGAGRDGGDRIVLPAGLALGGRALVFHIASFDFAFSGYGSPAQIPLEWIGDGYADVLWNFSATTGEFQLWIDADDDGRFDPTDLLLRIRRVAGDTGDSIGLDDLIAQFGAFYGSGEADLITGTGAADEVMWGGGGDDTLQGLDGVDQLMGQEGDDSLLGGDASDWLNGGSGSDTLIGGDGFDTLFAADLLTPETESASARNLLDGGAGDDQLFGGLGLDTLDGGPGADLLWGDAGDDSLAGGADDDILYGLLGDDVLDGGSGADTLLPGLGSDVVRGGAGADLFILPIFEDSVLAASGASPDFLFDFRASEGDRISLGILDGVLNGPLGPAQLLWRGATAPLDAALSPLGTELGGADIGPGFYQAWFVPVRASGNPAGGWFVIDLDQDGLFGAEDYVLRISAAGAAGASEALTAAAFLDGSFAGQVGTARADTIAAAATGQLLLGLGGDDLLAGGAGQDRLLGGADDDTLRGEGSADELFGGTGNDVLDGGDGNDSLFSDGPGIADFDGFTASNTLTGGLGNDSLFGSNGRDAMDGGDGSDVLFGGSNADSLLGGDGNDTLSGGDGNDTIDGGAGTDRILAGPGNDVVIYDPADSFVDGGDDLDILVLRAPATVDLSSTTDQVAGDGGITIGFEGIDATLLNGGIVQDGSAAANLMIGSAFADRLSGLGGNDTLEGGDGNDTLNGGSEDDLLLPGAGADLVFGGTGFDTVSYITADAGVVISLAEGRGSAGDAAGDTLQGIEALRGSEFRDTLIGDSGANWLEGGGAVDFLQGLEGDDTLSGGGAGDWIDGGAGNDSLSGGTGDDTLLGGAGDDVLAGGAGADEMRGGTGNDTYLVEVQGDVIREFAGEGSDTVLASGSYYLWREIECLVLLPGAGAIFGVGNASANLMRGNESNNLMIGWDASDTILGGAGGDVLYGVTGDDRLIGDTGVDYLIGGDGNDSADGGADPDALYGEGGNDTLLGGAGLWSDILVGGAGDDWLDGGGGKDFMYGNLGNDTFIVNQRSDLVFEQPGEGVDRVIARDSADGFYLYANIEELVLQGTTSFGVGNELANLIIGSAGPNTLLGGLGDDTIEGGGGNDALFGEAGRDSFIFRPGAGVDAVGGFTPGTDRVLLAGTALTSFADVLAAAVDSPSGVVISYTDSDAVRLNGVLRAALQEGDFLFA